MTARSLDHVNIVTGDLDATVRFYVELIGLRFGPRPGFAFPGAWLYLGGRPVLHLVAREAAPGPTGSIDHIAFECDDFDGMRERLERAGLPFDAREVPGGALRQLFVHDPNGVKIELNFRAQG